VGVGAKPPEQPARWRVSDGEEAHLVPGPPPAAEIRSSGALPLRARRPALHHARPAFPGTAVVLGEAVFEVVGEDETDGAVLYRLRPWPDGEVFRDRVVYGPAFVRSVEAGRQNERRHARVRPWRFLLYPLVGMLPEELQERLSDRLGIYSVTATLVSGLVESFLVLALLALFGAVADRGRSVALLLAAPGLILLVLPGLGRAFGAFFLRETGGSPVVIAAVDVLQALGALRERARDDFSPLTRSEFWRRLAEPDALLPSPDGSVLLRSRLPHLGWDRARRLEAGHDYWQVEPQPPERQGRRFAYSYRLRPLGDPPEPGAPGPAPPAPTAYADEVMGGVRCEWDALNSGFAWLTSMLDAELQSRAFSHRGGPAAVRRATIATAVAGALLAIYLLSFLPGPPGDPLAPVVALASLLLLLDAGRRLRATWAGRYAPSLLRAVLPSQVLRPERLAYHAHRDAERRLRSIGA